MCAVLAAKWRCPAAAAAPKAAIPVTFSVPAGRAPAATDQRLREMDIFIAADNGADAHK